MIAAQLCIQIVPPLSMIENHRAVRYRKFYVISTYSNIGSNFVWSVLSEPWEISITDDASHREHAQTNSSQFVDFAFSRLHMHVVTKSLFRLLLGALRGWVHYRDLHLRLCLAADPHL